MSDTKVKNPKVKRAKSTSTEGHYVPNSKLLPEVIRAKELGVITPELIQMIEQIAIRYSYKYTFVGYSFREDMVRSAVFNLVNNGNALKFNTEKSNPFSYYTTAIYNSFLQYLGQEKKQRKIRDELLLDAGSNPSFNFMQGEKDESHFDIKESDNVGVSGNHTIQMSDKDLYPERQPGPVHHIKKDDIEINRETGEVFRKSTGKLLFVDESLKAGVVIKPKPKKRVLQHRDEITTIDHDLPLVTEDD